MSSGHALRRTRPLALAACLAGLSGSARAGDPLEQWRLQNPYSMGPSSALDSQGNLVQFGGAFHTIKVAPDGTILWDRVFDIAGAHTVPSWITVDAQDNVIVGGYHEGATGGLLAVKYDPDGNQLWSSVADIRPGAEARRVAVDELGDVYVFGEIWGGMDGKQPTGNDFFTVKFDAAGNFLWARDAHASGSDEPVALAVRGGLVAVTGHAGGPFFTVCYDYAGNELWSDVYADGIWGAEDVAIGPSGQVVVCGWGTTDGNFPYVGTVVEYGAAGTELWRLYHNGPNGPVDNFRRLAIDDAGAVVAVGWASDSGGYEDWSIVKVDPMGNLLWSHTYDGTDGFMEYALSVELGPRGEVYVGGKAGPSCTGIGLEGHVLKFAADGTPEWVFPLECGDFPGQLHLDASGALMASSSVHTFRIVEPLGTPYCSPAVPNSTGLGALIAATGSAAVAHQDLHLTAYQLPPQQFGYFLASETQGFVANPGGSQGNLCLGGTIGRFRQQVQQSGAGGMIVIPVDMTALPPPLTTVQPGETWNFQAWFRDVNPTPTSNFTEAELVAFQ